MAFRPSPHDRSRSAAVLRSVRRAVRLRRRLLAAGLAAGAVALGLGVVAPAPPPTTPVVLAAANLTGGGVLGPADLAVRRFPPAAVPAGAAHAPARWVGRTLAAPMRAGEPVTDVRVVGPGLVAAYAPGTVAAPVRIADADSVALTRVGDRVDVIAPDPRGQLSPTLAVGNAPVVAIPAVDDELGSSTAGALVVLAVSPTDAQRVAAQSVLGPLVLSLRE
jgi:Flp pilus assembly protein CpaB